MWEIFKLYGEPKGGFNVGVRFEHLPRAYEIMGWLLTEVGMYAEAELCLGDAERRGFSLVGPEIFVDWIEGYARVGNWGRSVRLFDQMRCKGFVPTAMCYEALISLLVKNDESHTALRVCSDMLDQGILLTDNAKVGIGSLVNLLCGDERVQEARGLIKRAAGFGYVPCSLAANGIFRGYCKKRDFEDLVSFSMEFKCPPDVKVGNKILQTLCSNYGSERANLYRLELEHVGFVPDETSFGILIGWCCRERNLKGASTHFSEMLERGLKPELYMFNALLSGLFRESMWRHALHIVDEMKDGRTVPDLSTYKILLAGYCKVREFNEVIKIVEEMWKVSLIELSSTEDPICRAFSLLGFDPLAIRLKRDGGVGLSRTEFYDSLGNGLYLDTDVEEFDGRLDKVLKDSVLPDFNSIIMQESVCGNLEHALTLMDKSDRWGQELSPNVLSTMVKSLCESRFPVKAIIRILAKCPNYVNLMDEGALNLLLQLYSYRGLHLKAWDLFNRMVGGSLAIRYETYSRFAKCLCKRGDSTVFAGFLRLVRKLKCSLQSEDFKAVIRCLCQKGLVYQAVELFKILQMITHDSVTCDIFVEELSDVGFATVACRVVQEMPPADCCLTSIAYNRLVIGLCQEKDRIKVLQVYDDMKSKLMVPSADASVKILPFLLEAQRFAEANLLRDVVLSHHPDMQRQVEFALFKGYCMANVLGDAARLFQSVLFNKTAPITEACDTILRAIVRVGNPRKAQELLGLLIRENVRFSISSFRMLVQLMSIGGRICHMLSLKEMILRESLSDNNIVVYNVMIYSAFTSGNILLVPKILDEMNNKELVLTEASYNFLLCGFSRCDDLSRARYYLSAMLAKEMRPSNRSLRSIIYCLNESDRIGEILQELESHRWLCQSTVQNAIIFTLVDRGMLSGAEAFVDRTIEKGLLPDGIIYDSLIRELCRRNKPNKAFDLLNVMLRKKCVPSASCYNALVCGLSKQHELETALDVHAEMAWREIKLSFEASDELIRECCEVGRTIEAERFLMSVVRSGDNPTREMFARVIGRYRSENNTRKASELINIMRQSGHEPDFETHWSIISKLKPSEDKSKGNRHDGFLSRILSGSGLL
ncbi:hypothetical protein MLD38_001499 [Melastoma candidum]|nr:hypothetical protein MLD38_001499 [Melastoma candidum]